MSALATISAAPAAVGGARSGQSSVEGGPSKAETGPLFSDVLGGRPSPTSGPAESAPPAEQSGLAPEQEIAEEPVADDAGTAELKETLALLQGAGNEIELPDALANAEPIMPTLPTAVPALVQGTLQATQQLSVNEADSLQQYMATLRQAPAAAVTGSETAAANTNSSLFELLQNMAAGKVPPALADSVAGGSRGDGATPLYALVAGQPAGATAAAANPALPLPAADAQAAFEQTLDRVAWMAREGLQQARLQLQPAHLGRIDIVLDMEGTEARLHMASQQPLVRDALEALLPRLRDALAEQGIQLADASVADSGRQTAEHDSSRDSGTIASADTADAAASEGLELQSAKMQSVGLLDLYV
ncbi:hypothetical protein CWI75_01045 [Kineobactrum sediminis]|uniref:Flagellar hook-length control protein-like C-terminal domain-containing protein n=1 Tax=Kineobactrum sediminis TaxID=1905677 RepID=A0A2N5Y6E6_9GAMM|nr:flagellar hook-length control protein FliK [Kineobactrum sediminis]PLW83970.1 hypothetical protein CWI75_01045 [Kineobactrum sediminis]